MSRSVGALVSRSLVDKADAAYRQLVEHCSSCPRCRARVTCPEASTLRRSWKTAWKAAR